MKKSFKDYDLLEVVGKGGMATLYKGFQRSLGRNVAIKELHAFLIDNEQFIDRFEREARALATLQHDNIVHVHDFGKEEGSYFIVMEFIDGDNLKELMAKTEKFPLEIALMIIHQICLGLEHAHYSGITHRDMKPGNVLMNKFGVVKIADFGLAQAANLESITVTGSLIGTPAYMSPEQAAGKKVDERSDIFSTGVILYEMISGKKPYDGDSYSSVIAKILTQKPREIREIEPNIPEPLEKIIKKSLEKDVEKRYHNITDMIQDIENYFASLGITPNKRIVKTFIENPAEYKEKYKDKFIKEHLNKGVYFMQMGLEKFDDASTEFNRVLEVDPKNQKARQYLKDMKKQKEESGIFEPEKKPFVPPPASTDEPGTQDQKPQQEAPTVVTTPKYIPPRPKKKKTGLIVGTIIVVIIAALAFLQFGTDYKFIIKSDTPVTDLHIEYEPEDAVFLLDGEQKSNQSPVDLSDLKVGKHTIHIRKEGFKDIAREIILLKDSTFKQRYILEELPGPGKPEAGTIKVKTNPATAKITLDEKVTKISPAVFNNVEPGVHILTISHEERPGFKVSREKSINVKAGDVQDLDIDLNPEIEKLMSTSLTIMTSPSGAAIYQDGNSLKQNTPIQLSPFAPGKYTFKLIKKGYITREINYSVKPGEKNKLSVKLDKVPVEPQPQPQPQPQPIPEPEPTPPPQPQTAYLKIKVVPWAKIYIDGKYIDTTPIPKPVEVKSGSHVIKAENPQFEVWEQTINFPGGQTIEKTITLKKKEPEPGQTGSLKISVTPWAKLYIDGKFIDTTPIAKPIELSAGQHKIKLENPQTQVWEETVEIKAGETLEKNIKLIFK